MSDILPLVVFDCDGTLVDSLHAIIHAMNKAFKSVGHPAPTEEAIRGIVGLSVPEAVMHLAPSADEATLRGLDQEFRAASIAYRRSAAGKDSPLFPGVKEALKRLEDREILMAVATGKARRGLDHVLELHGIAHHFSALQTADDAPSKPHPGMLENCERLTGATRKQMIVVGDTTFDIEMARSHGCRAIGVSWGYHAVDRLFEAGADTVIDRFSQLDAALDEIWGNR